MHRMKTQAGGLTQFFQCAKVTLQHGSIGGIIIIWEAELCGSSDEDFTDFRIMRVAHFRKKMMFDLVIQAP